MKDLNKLTIEQVASAINMYGESIPFKVLKRVAIPEADVLLCEYKNTRVNLKFDLDYGFDIEFLEKEFNNRKSEISNLLLNWISFLENK